jgi:hypothetical protein
MINGYGELLLWNVVGTDYRAIDTATGSSNPGSAVYQQC